MKLSPYSLLCQMLLVVAPLSASSRDSAFVAQKLIGPEIWSQVVRIENPAATPEGVYPAEFHGLVIAFADVLWLYTEHDGTQNLSMRRGQVATDDASLGEMLSAVDPAWVLGSRPVEPPPVDTLPAAPPNGCFLACLVHWQKLQQTKRPPKEARLIACYAPGRTTGHMLLQYRRGRDRYVFDPARPAKPLRLRRGTDNNPLVVARTVLGELWEVPPVRATPLELIGPKQPVARRLATADIPPLQPRS